MLLELTSDYVRFLTVDSLTTRKNNMNQMNELLKSHLGKDAVSKLDIRELFNEIFRHQLDVIVAVDPKKPEKLKTALAQAFASNPGSAELYESILLGMNSSDLELWTKDVVKEKVDTLKHEAELKKQSKKGKSFFGKVFGKKDEGASGLPALDTFVQIEQEILEFHSKRTAMSGNQISRANVPDMSFEFVLNSMNLTLVNDM